MSEATATVISYIATETINDPTAEKIQCKFVVIDAPEDQLLVVVGEYERFPFHAHIVQRYCLDRGIPVQSGDGGENAEIGDRDHSVKGGGWLEINIPQKTLRWYGASKAYGKFAPESIEQISLDSGLWEGYNLTCE